MARPILEDELQDLGLDTARLREAAEHHPLIRRAAVLLARRRNCSDAEALRQILRTSVEIRKPIADVARAVLSAELDS
jgi:AmiR/NasT family two-component response regulator